MSKVRPQKPKGSLISTAVNLKKSKTDLKNDNFLNFSFRHLDLNQGATLQQWSDSGMLLNAINTIKNVCTSSIKTHIGTGLIAVYGSFPVNTSFTFPKFVPEDAEWGRIHINGTHILAGHFVSETFYIVFLDNDHSFYKTEKKHT